MVYNCSTTTLQLNVSTMIFRWYSGIVAQELECSLLLFFKLEKRVRSKSRQLTPLRAHLKLFMHRGYEVARTISECYRSHSGAFCLKLIPRKKLQVCANFLVYPVQMNLHNGTFNHWCVLDRAKVHYLSFKIVLRHRY